MSEYSEVEAPLINQFKKMGWTHLPGAEVGALAVLDPERSERGSFDEVFLERRLRAAIHRINLGPDGKPWLDEHRISQAVNALRRPGPSSLLEANQKATERLINGIPIAGLDGWNQGRDQQIHFIDWHPAGLPANDFTVVSQFRVNIPGKHGPKNYVVLDLVLFVNGIPLVVVECKRPGNDATAQAVKQLRRYAECPPFSPGQGVPKLFTTVQLTVAASGEDARLGTFTAEAEHYVPWRDPFPLSKEELADQVGGTVRGQEILAGVVLHPRRLLDIAHNYVTFLPTKDGITVKAAPRYQQYRAVEKSVRNLRTQPSRKRDGRQDRRGGIIWHTQGSGKSLTMTFLVRKLRMTPGLDDMKVVLVTDRTQLQTQLSETMRLTGEKVDIAKSVEEAKADLAKHGPGVVFVMIQKQQDVRGRGTGVSDRNSAFGGELNTDESILVLIDEAHRSHGSALHANLLEALPNCARIGFTGTPIIKERRARKTTMEIFGDFIDKYRLKEAEEDGVIVPIFYEGYATKGAVRDGRDLDEVFEDMFDLTDEQREQLQKRYATKGDVLEAEKLIAAKARSMLRHYVETVLPGGYKAQLVASSRLATLRYRTALIAARDELVREIEGLPAHLLKVDPNELKSRRKFLVTAARRLDLIRRMDFTPVISADGNDTADYHEWTDPAGQDRRIEAFTHPFGEDEERPIAFLIVKSMLLTGFDAPIEQVMYIDRSLREAELLQAIARVNRVDGPQKKCGYVVDYFGVANHLNEALKAYAEEDIRGALKDITDEALKLEPQRARLRMLFTDRGIRLADADDPGLRDRVVEDCVELLADLQLRDRFEVELKGFLTTVDAVLPNPEAKPYLADVKLFALIKLRTARRYRVADGEFDPSLYGAKIRDLIDQHVESLGVEQNLPPVALTSPDFDTKVAAMAGGSRAKASEMEHALRHHIDVHLAEDPERYRRLSERLERILEEFKENFEQQVLAFATLISEARDERPEYPHGLGPVEGPLYGVLLAETHHDGVLPADAGAALADVARTVHGLAVEVTTRRDFWHKETDKEAFRNQIARELLDVCGYQQIAELADKLFDVIEHNRNKIVRG
ncbi:type I restriction endonuclease subunit R [Sphaerisporangium perillae]|uniref:type I restriction endonuclease subunit R n=1 Tax=Sphaerisporangium perillae TaxID=2935860 RepID=UPI00200EBFB2|nr:HsdR family type I site-specific deoxyribonuclease [Sphaerisporangium perillae]